MRKQRFLKQTLNIRTSVKRIIEVYDQSTEDDRITWYSDALDFALYLCKNYRTAPNYFIVAGVISALSPQKSWDENKRLAENFFKNPNRNPGHTRVFYNKALAIMKLVGGDLLDRNDVIISICDILNGPKIRSFFLNIAVPEYKEIVTIDRHAISIVIGRPTTESDKINLTANQYKFFQDCYILAAKKAGVDPSYMQSVTWCAWRRLKKPPVTPEDYVPF
jgi:hypothetical protein